MKQIFVEFYPDLAKTSEFPNLICRGMNNPYTPLATSRLSLNVVPSDTLSSR